jgi:hypothetical protein
VKLEDYITRKYVIAACHDRYKDWMRRNNKSSIEYAYIWRAEHLQGLERDKTEVIFLDDYWHARDFDHLYQQCKVRNFKIVHIDKI